MKKILLSAWILILSLSALAQNHNVFHTSVCYDMLSSFDSYEKLISNPFFANTLAKDSVYIADVQAINLKVRPSNLCNLYASLPTDKNDVNACYRFLESLKQDDIPEKFRGKYVENIFSVMPQIRNAIRQMIRADYPKYWEEQVYPVLKQRIEGFTFEDGILDKIHNELTGMAGGDTLSEEYAKIYILDISNAFSLNDETFCCTSVLLDKETAKKYRINFIQVYIHENLHRLYLSKALMNEVENLYKKDAFYRKSEDVARNYREGQNEAFIVAAETYISHKLGLKTDEDVYREFQEYVGGSLVLAPIVYTRLSQKTESQSFDRFLLNLFETEFIKSGNVEKQYRQVMEKLKRGYSSDM